MKKFLKKLWKSEKGFTLVELIIVIAILAVLAGIAVPNLLGNIQDSRKKADLTNAQAIANSLAQEIAKDENFSGAIATDTAPLKFVNTAIGSGGNATVNAAVANFQSELKAKYKAGSFYVYVEASGLVHVYVLDSTYKEIYPSVHNDYN